MLLSLLAMTLTSAGLALQAVLEADVWVVYKLLSLDAVVGSLGRPARSSLVPRLVPREAFPGAVAWNNSMF